MRTQARLVLGRVDVLGEHGVEGDTDLEATVAKNVRRLREGRGISQQQLGTDLFLHGVGMHQTTVAKLEAGSKPLRLNEVAAIAAYSEVPIESLWEETGEILNEHEVAVMVREIMAVEAATEQARESLERASAEVERLNREYKHVAEAHHEAESNMVNARRRQKVLDERLAMAQAALGRVPGGAIMLTTGGAINRRMAANRRAEKLREVAADTEGEVD